MAEFEGEPIECKAVICCGAEMPLIVEKIHVLPPEKDEVRIKVVATAWCRSDAHVVTGHATEEYGIKFPCILGHEASGIVESVGEDVTSLEPGDHVLTCCFPQCGTCVFCE